MTVAILVENLSKCYTVAHQRKVDRNQSLRLALEQGISFFGARFLGKKNRHNNLLVGDEELVTEDFYALKDVSFELKIGERLGIIGSNGAGKSTLLKILSRITEPTQGKITIRGRVSSLLEVGTGFHPELTGRENIYLNGAILGMPRSEIRKKFDEIVAFAEVERFLDTPVKHYSSGMYVRLAFSVSAHLDPEVLILDEVLAVGDARFQMKCMNKMRRFSEEGRTVLFVSHSSSAISQFCSSAILLERGRIKEFGPAQEVVERYMLQSIAGMDEVGPGLKAEASIAEPVGDEYVQVESIELINSSNDRSGTNSINDLMSIRMDFRVLKETNYLFIPNLHIRAFDGSYVTVLTPPDLAIKKLGVGVYSATCEIPANFLNNGIFTIQAAITSFNLGQVVHASIPNALVFEVIDDLTDISYRNGYMYAIPGVIRPRLSWQIESSK
jgi:lipopolysaccharide transport system ATP-binding protein